MFNGKKKAITFSYDDGVTQDIRLIELFNKYGLKGTFNLNSEFLGGFNTLVRDGQTITHNKNKAEDVRHIYDGHEVAVHTLTHPFLPAIEDENENEYLKTLNEIDCEYLENISKKYLSPEKLSTSLLLPKGEN